MVTGYWRSAILYKLGLDGDGMAKKKVEVPEGKLAAYDWLIATVPEIERKGVTSPYTSVNGHMFSYLSKTGSMGLRLPKDEREAFLENIRRRFMNSMGRL